MTKTNNLSRRIFLRQLGGTTALLTTSSLRLEAEAASQYQTLQPFKRVAANDKIRVACIGMGIMGFGDTQTALKVPGVELAGVCDLYDGRLIRSKEVFNKDLFTTRDYREILNRKDIDAIIVATSDHWHDKISIEAMEKGKAVYCEKPMVHHIEEGGQVIATQKKTGRILQVGSQRISGLVHAQAKKLYEAGEIGELNMIEATMDRHDALGAWQYSIPPGASPKTIDWQTFLGDAPKVAFDPVRFFRWRNYRDYGTGVPGDLFVHLITGVHFITGSLGPSRIYASGNLSYWKDGRDVPDVMVAVFDYPKTEKHPAFQMTLRVNFADGSGGGSVTRLVGSEGVIQLDGNTVTVTREKLPAAPGYGGWDSFDTFPEATQKEFVKQYNATYGATSAEIIPPNKLAYTEPKGYNARLEHFNNFFEAMRTGKSVVEDASFGLRAAGPALAANVSYFDKRVVNWDTIKMQIINA